MAAGAAGDLRHFSGGQPTPSMAVELGEAGKGDMIDVHVEAHADRVGRDQIIDLAGLIHGDLGVAGAGAERAHHHRRAAAHPAQHLGDRVNLLGGEGDDRRARRQAGELRGTDIGKGRETRAGGDLGVRQKRSDHGFERLGAEDHRLLPAARMQHPVGEDVATLGIRAELRLVQSDEGEVLFHRHGFRRAEEPARVLRYDLLLAGDQRHLIGALQLHDPVVNLARQQAQREADHAGRMSAHPLDRQIGLPGIGRAENGLQVGVHRLKIVPRAGKRNRYAARLAALSPCRSGAQQRKGVI